MHSANFFFASGLGCVMLSEFHQGLKPAFVFSLGGTAESCALPEIIGGVFPAGFAFAPSGLDSVRSRTHGLRRGLCSCAASRLVYRGSSRVRRGLLSGASLLTAGFVLRRFVITFALCP